MNGQVPLHPIFIRVIASHIHKGKSRRHKSWGNWYTFLDIHLSLWSRILFSKVQWYALFLKDFVESALSQVKKKWVCYLNCFTLLSDLLNIEKDSHPGWFLLTCISFGLLILFMCTIGKECRTYGERSWRKRMHVSEVYIFRQGIFLYSIFREVSLTS